MGFAEKRHVPVADRGLVVPTKTQQLLCFLRDVAKIRRKRVWAYGENDRVLWVSEVPAAEPECNSPFHEMQSTKSSSWLTIRKPQIPLRPAPPAGTLDWAEGGEDQLDDFKADPPELRAEITTLAVAATEHFGRLSTNRRQR